MDGVFLSTPSARRATGRPSVQAVVVAISIHALREEGDVATLVMAVPSGHFYPRPPRGGRPGPQLVLRCSRAISIHALREEGDRSRARAHTGPIDFYPRPPRGGRQGAYVVPQSLREFLSTPSARRATLVLCTPDSSIGIFLSTPSARRATAETLEVSPTMIDFYPRPPRGGRQLFLCGHSSELYFYPRPPRGGRHQQPRGKKRAAYFYPRPPRGGRQ